MPNSSDPARSASRKRSTPAAPAVDEVFLYSVPANDSNSWYYPSNELDSDTSDLEVGTSTGNWGKKHLRNARWVRKGKMVAWGPGMDDWEAEERARKRMRLLLPQSVRPARSPSPPSLPHLRSPSPPPIGPYPPVTTQHPTYASFVLDKFNTHTFRSHQLDDLEKVTNSSIEAAAVLKKALGRLWQAISEDPDRLAQPTATATATDPETAQTLVPAPSLVPKEEPMDSEHGDPEDEAERERAERIARAPDLTPTTYKIFLSSYPPEDVSDSALAGMPIGGELEVLEKGLAALHEVQDDDREFVERLEEIRDGLGSIRNKRDTVWDIVRRKALAELQEAATVMS